MRTISMARTTPAQKPRGFSRSSFLPLFCMSLAVDYSVNRRGLGGVNMGLEMGAVGGEKSGVRGKGEGVRKDHFNIPRSLRRGIPIKTTDRGVHRDPSLALGMLFATRSLSNYAFAFNNC